MTARRKLPIYAALLVFGMLAVLRLNPFCLLEPDSPDYLFTARSLATFDGYLEIDHPARTPHAFRPPGLSILLVPMAWIAPYSVVAAKLWILGSGIGLLILLQRFTRLITNRSTAILVSLIVACSPYTLLHGTEVLSEVPFLVLIFGLLLALGYRETADDAALTTVAERHRVLVTVILIWLPLMRTVGFAMLGALLVWSIFVKARRTWLAPLAAALIVNGLWWWRGTKVGSTTYLEGMSARLHDLGGWGYLGTVWDQALFYIKAFAGFVLPGVFFGSPMYERVLIGDAPRMPGAGPLGLVAVAAFLLVALWGLVARRRSDGTLVAIYLLLFLALLAIYPPRQERLIWPLVPVLWVYAAVGILDLRRRLQDAARGSSSFYDRGLRYGIGGFVVAVLALQLYASVAVVATNISWWRGGDSFYEEQVPPGYFADWRRAGMEIAKLGQPWARVLTRHSDVGLTSQRLQDSMRFEEVSPAVLTRAIVGLPARYVAIASTEFRKVAPAHLFEESATFRFQTVWQGRGVRVFEVLPNREGVGSIVPDDLEGRIERCQSAIAIHPRRRDLRRRHVQLLRDARRIEEAVAALDSLEETLGTDARSAWLRGTLLLDLGRYDDAADALNRGILLPDVGRVERSLRRGITRAVEGKRRATEESPPARVRRLVDEAGSFLDSGLLRSATIWLNRAAAIAPGDPSVAFLVSRLDERSGNRERAVRRLERLRSAGHRAAAGLLEEWELERRLLAGEVKLPPSGYVRFAARRTAEGRPGRGLALLERAHRNWPQSVDVARGLGLSWWFHGRPDLAAPLLESVVKTHPGDRESIDALTACRRVLEVD